MIHELRTYTLLPGRARDYVELARTIAQPIRGDRYGTLVGYWSTEVGPLNQVVHLWAFDDVATRATVRAALAKDARWIGEYLPRSQPLLVTQENVLLVPVDWYPPPPPSGAVGNAVYELRTDRLRPGKLAEWGRTVRGGLPVRQKYSSPAGIWQTEVGPLNTVVHLWPYRDLQHRTDVLRGLDADPAWAEVRAAVAPLIQAQESKLLLPAPFSPLR